MRKSLVVLVLAATMALSPAAMAFETIPAGHWAAQAVEDLNGEGVLIGYPDGTFRGANAATRYELAIALKRLENVVNGLVANGTASATKVAGVEAAPSPADTELAGEVARIKELVTALQEATRQDLAADARRDKALNDLIDSVLALEDGLKAKVDSGRLDELQKAIDELKGRLAALDQLQSQLKTVQADVGSLRDQLGKLSAENSALKSELQEQKSKLQQMYLWIAGAALLGIVVK